MKKFFIAIGIVSLFACNNKKEDKTFEVEGNVKNANAKMVYLEENIPNGQPTIMDSATLDKDGNFQLQSKSREESLYQLRLEGKMTPFALLISDVSKAKVQADLNDPTQPYSVQSSPASQALINFDKTTYERGM